ncbi:MAG: long-chain-fatty-acid--CoA ligase [Hyphomicrobiales bacterium]|nr:long-chain-fatty-acid--CoA ligase [Hyphomicrobiales bacterium]
MLGLMMDQQLLVNQIIDHAARYHSDTQIVSVNTDGGQFRYDYGSAHSNILKLASSLIKLGLKKSDRVATIAWNNHRHFETYYAISGGGMVCHTLNPRLFPEQLIYIINHAEDKALFFDKTFLPLVEGVRKHLKTVEHFVLLEDTDNALRESNPWLSFYDELLAEGDENYSWPDNIEERDACSLCYTSGTTGNPKGVLYSHRSTLIHAMMSATPDVMNFSARDCLLPVVPMFHVNAWGTPYAAPMVGAKLVLPGPGLDGESLTKLFLAEKVTISAGVPTIWGGLLDYLDASNIKLPDMQRTIVGGSACPPAMLDRFRDDYGIEVLHAWGMTELSPLGTVNNLKNKHLELSADELRDLRILQGRPPFGIELGIFDEDANQLPNDGKSQGDLYCRGPWVVSEYFAGEGGDPLVNGWFPTGDVATLDEDGFMCIRDRSKDIIKSGGEWISSVDLENLAMGHPDIADAAVIAVLHPKWDERPLLLVVGKAGIQLDEASLLQYYEGKVAKWWIPDAVKIVDEIPRNATGKIRKNILREAHGNALM